MKRINLLLLVMAMTAGVAAVSAQPRSLVVRRVAFDEATPTAERINAVLDSAAVEFHNIEYANWPEEYPYKPSARFRIAYSATEIYLQYAVAEQGVRAVYGQDEGSRPYTDSCVEFFIIPAENDEIYYNLEMTCIGVCTFDGGELHKERKRFGAETTALIRRTSSLGDRVLGETDVPTEWILTVAVPIEVFALSEIAPLAGRTVRANFYKCGDGMRVPHYLSWSPIDAPRPNFHLPAFFGYITFEQ